LTSRTTKEAQNVNVVTLIGNLATDDELKEVAGGKQVATFVLAVDRSSGEGADFLRVSTWERQAETCAQYLSKGRRVALDGRLRSRSWEEEGKRRTAVEVVANRVQFLSGPNDPPPADAAELPFEAAAV
jgi:single-strand DNA-binding protein